MSVTTVGIRQLRGRSVVAIWPAPLERDEMLATEDEAKQRWCPFGRFDSAAGGSYNRDYQGGPSTMCIASQCMAWRWQPLQADQPFMDAVKKRMDDSKDKHPVAVKYVRANLTEFDLPDKPFRGFCGLAQVPLK